MPSQIIPVADAATMTALLRAEQNNILEPTRRDEGIIPICETFDRSAIEAILAIPGCAKVRIYTGMEQDLKIVFVITGVNSKGQDIFITDTSTPVETEFVVETGVRCPVDCPPPSPLNS